MQKNVPVFGNQRIKDNNLKLPSLDINKRRQGQNDLRNSYMDLLVSDGFNSPRSRDSGKKIFQNQKHSP